MAGKKTLLFDFGGTLDTDGVHWFQKDKDIYNYFNIKIDEAEFRNAYIASERRIEDANVPRELSLKDTLRMQLSFQLQYLLENSLKGRSDSEKLLEEMTDYCYNDVRMTLRTAYEVLAGLKQDYRLGLVSNFYGNLMNVCMETNLYNLFEVIVDSAVAGVRKPDPLIFQIAADRMNIQTGDGIVIGDSYINDIVSAKSIGFTTIWIRNKGWNEPDDVTNADHIISSFTEIPRTLNNIF
jgi:HAD superfamily hydrolase (TIGR01549 family)